MKKFLLSIFALMLAVFSVQAEEVKYQISSTTAVTTNGTVPSGSTATFKNTYTSNKEQLTKNNSMTLTLKGYTGCKITGITLYMKSNKSAGSGSFTMKAGATELSAITASAFNNKNWNGAYTTTYTDVVPAMKNADYIIGDGEDVIITIAATVNSLYCQSFTITYEKVGGSETPVAPAAPTLPTSCNFDNSMTIEITNIAEDATAFYSLNNDKNWTAGTSVKISETTTVYAKVVKDELSSEVVYATYTKNEPVTPPAEGEVVDVLTSSDFTATTNEYKDFSGVSKESGAVYAGQSAKSTNGGIQLRSKNSNSGIVTTKSGGKVKSVTIDVESGTNKLDIYGKNTPYTAASDLYDTSKQGTKLGTLSANGTLAIEGGYEYIGLRSNSGAMYLTSVSITWNTSAGATPVAPNAPVLPASTTFEGSMLVEITGIAADATVYYTTDESDPATSATRVEYTEPFEITATTTVKAVAVNEVGASEMATATYTLFVVKETTGYYVKVVSAPADWSGKYLVVYEEGADAYVFNGKDEVDGYVAATIDGGVIKANSEVDAVAVTIAVMEGGYSVETADGYISGIASGNKLNFYAKAQPNTIEMGTDGVDILAGRYLRFNSAKGDMRFRYYNLTYGESVQLYKYVTELPSHILSVTDAGWATLYLDFNALIPTFEGEDAGAYIVTGVKEGSWLKLVKVDGVLPANTGILVKADAKDGGYTFKYTATATANVDGNLLKGTTKKELITKDANKEYYALGLVDNIVCFYNAVNGDNENEFYNNAFKAYLEVENVTGGVPSASLRFDFGGTTGVEEVETEAAETVIYDLTGRRVNEITKAGVYIINGKKILVK